jgi:hypothetical protein
LKILVLKMEDVLRGIQRTMEYQVHQNADNNLDAFNLGFFSVISVVFAIGIYYKKELGIIREEFQNFNDHMDLV